MFQSVGRAYEHILLILRIERSVLELLSDVLSRRMALRANNRFSRSFKDDFGNVDDGMLHGNQRQCKLLFRIQGIEKSGLDEVA
jgi:hypothetical protein